MSVLAKLSDTPKTRQAIDSVLKRKLLVPFLTVGSIATGVVIFAFESYCDI